MSKNRMLNTKFWSDAFVVELNPLDRYLFLYLLSNEHTRICGIYELPLKTMSNETGLEQDMLKTMFKTLEDKMHYIESWVYLKNFEKHQSASPAIKRGIENSKKEVPQHILDKITNLSGKEIPSPDGIDTIVDPPSNINININRNINTKRTQNSLKKTVLQSSSKEANKEITEIFSLFEKINPTIQYGNKTQRSAVTELLDKIGFQKLVKIVEYASKVQGEKYSPVITTPCHLREKLSQLMVYYKKQETKKPNMVKV